MKALLDTHAFLWAIADDRRFSRTTQKVFAGPNDLWLSVAGIWEIFIKVKIGKLVLPQPAGPYLVKRLSENRIKVCRSCSIMC